MIRFIDLGKQIAVDESDPDYPRQFAWFDTVRDRFLVYDGGQVWDSWKDFELAYKNNPHGYRDSYDYTILRFKSLALGRCDDLPR